MWKVGEMRKMTNYECISGEVNNKCDGNDYVPDMRKMKRNKYKWRERKMEQGEKLIRGGEREESTPERRKKEYHRNEIHAKNKFNSLLQKLIVYKMYKKLFYTFLQNFKMINWSFLDIHQEKI